MKTKLLAAIFPVAAFATASAAPRDLAQLEVYPKNLARHHLGANLFHYTPTGRAYLPTEAAAAWLDDDISTGWPLLPGKQYYLLSLPRPELLTNFCLSSRAATGTISLYAGALPAAPGASSWIPMAHAVPFESINEKKLGHGFHREAKYVLLETDVADPGPIYSLYLYGEKPAVAFDIVTRDRPIDSHAVFGPFINEQTSFNLAGLYARTYVAHADGNSFVQWQRIIDDNPESAFTIGPSAEKPAVVVRFASVQPVSRISFLTTPGADGKLEFYLVNREIAANTAPRSGEEGNQYIKISADAQPTAESVPGPVSEATPTVSIVLDGTNPRKSIDFPATQANEMLIRWTPANSTDSIVLRELDTFGAPTLATHIVALKPEAVGPHSGKSKR